jgi:hypothetical protein
MRRASVKKRLMNAILVAVISGLLALASTAPLRPPGTLSEPTPTSTEQGL